MEGRGDDDPVEGDAPAGEEHGLAEDQGADRDVHRVADEAVEAADHQGAGGRDRGRGAKPLPGEAGEGLEDDDEAGGDQDEAGPAEGARPSPGGSGRQWVISHGIRPATPPGARTRKARLPSAALTESANSLTSAVASGRGGRTRTDDLVLPKHVRCQLRHTPRLASYRAGPAGRHLASERNT